MEDENRISITICGDGGCGLSPREVHRQHHELPIDMDHHEQANRPLLYDLSEVNGHMSTSQSPRPCQSPITNILPLKRYDPTIGTFPPSLHEPTRTTSNPTTPTTRGLLLRHPHHRRPTLLPLPHRHRRPRRIPRPLGRLEPPLRRLPPRLRHHVRLLSRQPRALSANGRHGVRPPRGLGRRAAGQDRGGE